MDPHPCTVVGIINCTPDSFSGDGLLTSSSKKLSLFEAALSKAESFIEKGCSALDIGGESTRPGFSPVSLEEETERTIPLIKELHKKFPHISLSIDTSKAELAERAFKAGALIVNDVSALALDPKMAPTIAKIQKKGYPIRTVLMHNATNQKLIIKNKQLGNSYAATHTSGPILKTLQRDLSASINNALTHGIKRESLIIDPGIGFGKTIEDNITIIAHIPSLASFFQLPIYIGASRKSFIGNILNKKPEDRLWGSLSVAAIAAFSGAQFIRVHDVEETLDVVTIAQKIRQITQDPNPAQDFRTEHDPA
jgi:dihydropteroate synthase